MEIEFNNNTDKPKFPWERENVVYGTGDNYRNAGRAYNLDILGEWVRWHREEHEGITLAQAAQRWCDLIGSKCDPPRTIDGSNWRLQYEWLEKPFTQTANQLESKRQVRNGLPTEAKCEHIATVLNLPLSQVRMKAGFLPQTGMKHAEILTLAEDMTDEEYSMLVQYAIQLRKSRDNHEE